MKQAIRYIDQPLNSAKTSRQHFYSEPRSILAPEKELSREELEALIAEHGQESRPESRLSQGSRPASRVENKQVRFFNLFCFPYKIINKKNDNLIYYTIMEDQYQL